MKVRRPGSRGHAHTAVPPSPGGRWASRRPSNTPPTPPMHNGISPSNAMTAVTRFGNLSASREGNGPPQQSIPQHNSASGMLDGGSLHAAGTPAAASVLQQQRAWKLFIVMELCPFGSLRNVLDHRALHTSRGTRPKMHQVGNASFDKNAMVYMHGYLHVCQHASDCCSVIHA